MQKDNSTFKQKASLRRALLREVPEPVVMETHGGIGALYRACYSRVTRGVVFEKDERKSSILASQRPTWAVYEADSARALQEGAGAHLTVNVLDLDPYGEPWPCVKAFFTSERTFAPSMWVVANDGLRSNIKMGTAWKIESLRPAVERFGSDIHGIYLEVCRYLLAEYAKAAGYTVRRFNGYYCGKELDLTHYAALLEQA